MSRPTVADFVDSFYNRILYQPDDEIASTVLSTELASDVDIVINGQSFTASEFISLITTTLRPAFLSSIAEIKDLNIKTTNDSGSTGVVAQWTSYVNKGKTDGKESSQIATLITKVEESEGKSVVTGIWEVAT